MNRVLLALLSVFIVWILFFKTDRVEYAPGVVAPFAPLQEDIKAAKSFLFNGYTITPLANFELQAKVLSKEGYRLGRESEISPVDLAFGWGRMSDEAIIKDISISQSNRWYRWYTEKMIIPRREIETNSANMHIIPKDEHVEETLKRVRVGDVVSLKGKLVRINAPDGWHWVSSLSRKDTGAGACELIFVDTMEIEAYPAIAP